MEQKQRSISKWVGLASGIALGVILVSVAIGVYLLLSAPKADALLLQVLQSRETFIGESGQADKLEDYVKRATGDTASAPDRYTLIDLDGDEKKEMVVYIACNPGKYLVFHIHNGKVYGFPFDRQDFQNLKTDGSFVQSKNSETHYFCTIAFENTTYRLKELAYQNRAKAKARLGGQEVTEQDMTLFALDFWKKPAVQWTPCADATDPIPLYREFLASKAAAQDSFVQKKLSEYIPSGKAYTYRFYDMTGDGQAELCVSSDYGIHIFTVQNKTLQHWYTGESTETRLTENGMVREDAYEYDLSVLYYTYRGLTELGHTMFLLPFSWMDVPYVSPDTYTFNGLNVSREEYENKTKEFLSLKEMAGETVAGNIKPANYDSLLLQVLNNKKTFQNEAGKTLYVKEHTAGSTPFDSLQFIWYTLLDLDGDGTNELVALFLPGDTSGCYMVFRVYKGQVYGYDFSRNSLQSLKTDGSFIEKDSNGDIYHLSLIFEGSGYKRHELAYCNSAYHADRVCRIGGRYVTLDQVTDYQTAFSLKPEAEWLILSPTAEDNVYALYAAFLSGGINAKQTDGSAYSFETYLLADSGTFSYSLLDMTGDGQEELIVKLTYNLHIFTVKDGQLWLWHTADALHYTLLNNGALLYERHGAAPENYRYEYRELDKNGNVKFRISFAWYDGTTVEEGVVHPDYYEINSQEVTKTEYEEKVLKYLQIGSDKIIWYPQAEKPESSQPGTLFSVLENKTPFVNEAGVTVYLAEHKLGEAGLTAVPKKYTLVDLDGDGTDELIAYVSPEYGAYLVLRVYEDKIYGYGFPERHMINLTADGTFVQSGGAGLNSFVTLTFTGTRYTLQEKAYSDVTANVYRLDGQRVTAEQANAFIQEFYSRPKASWSAFEEETDGDNKALYEAFLKGEATAALENGTEMTLAEYLGGVAQYGFSYTFMDRTHDGKPELCIKATNSSQYFFTIENGKLLHMYSGIMAYYRLLNDGGLLYERHWGNPPITHYAYMAMDETGAEKQVIFFSWYGSYTVDGEQHPERYCIDSKEVTKAEYEEKLKPYLEIGDDKVVWYDQDGNLQ